MDGDPGRAPVTETNLFIIRGFVASVKPARRTLAPCPAFLPERRPDWRLALKKTASSNPAFKIPALKSLVRSQAPSLTILRPPSNPL
jgi:hypothetical protein